MTLDVSAVPHARTPSEAKAQLTRHGLTIIEGVLDAAAVNRVKDALKAGIDTDAEGGVQLNGFGFDPDTRNTRVFDLVGKHAIFRELVEHPLAMEMVRYHIGDGVLLSNFSANVTAPGSGPMGLHADQGFVPAPWPHYPLAINVAWALDDFTIANGATRFIPGSHETGHGPDASAKGRHVPIECKAGSIFVMDGRVWHETGPNISRDQTRAGLFAYYVRSFIRPQWDYTRTMPDAALATCSPSLLRMLGFDENPTSGLAALYLKDKSATHKRAVHMPA